jgi:hypothetical protein
MKKTTYISGLTLRYSCQAVDRTGVDAANAQDQAEADCLSAGLDEKGLWHTPNPELIEDAPTLSWESLRNSCIIGGIMWAVIIGLIWLVAHYAPQIDRWHL